MGRGLTASVRSLLATLCVALSVVFAGASAASVVDRVQHSAQTPHAHLAASVIAADDHHADHRGHEQPDEVTSDRETGVGHHHVDAPTASVARAASPAASVAVTKVSLPRLSTSAAKGTRPGGPERPPKDLANTA